LVFIAEIEGQELSEFVERLSANDDPRIRLDWFVQYYAAYVALPENSLLGVEILTEALRNPTIAEVFGSNRERLITALADCITQGGVFAPQADSSAIACIILDALEGKGLRSLSISLEDQTKNAIGVFILNGLKP
jgi:hypothetical protein